MASLSTHRCAIAASLRLKNRDWGAIFRESSRVLYEEVDYTREGRNAERFSENFKGTEWIKAPKINWARSTRKASNRCLYTEAHLLAGVGRAFCSERVGILVGAMIPHRSFVLISQRTCAALLVSHGSGGCMLKRDGCLS